MTSTGYPRPFGPYVLLDRIGEGGMSEVDLARRAVDDADYVRFVVIKRIQARHAEDDSFIRMFHDEARINAELQHENIATVYDFGQEGEEFFLAMEYVPGCDLRRIQRLLARRKEPFPLRIAVRILADVLAGLDYAHTRVDTFGQSMNIVHRDVNPRNIMLSVRGEVKLIDFGVAMADNRAEKTVGHSLKGKFAYMAPEQIQSGMAVDGRADVFAVGIVMYELLMGASPVAGLSEVQTMHRILAGQLPPVQGTAERPVPQALVDIHAKACAVAADDRFDSAGAMRKALVGAAEALGGMPDPVELSGFLRGVDPDLSTVSSRLTDFRTDEFSESRASPVVPPPAERSGSVTLAGAATQTVHAPTVAAAAGAGVLVGALVLVVFGGILWWATRQGPAPEPATAVTAPAEAPPAAAEPAAAEPTEAVPTEAPAPVAPAEPVGAPTSDPPVPPAASPLAAAPAEVAPAEAPAPAEGTGQAAPPTEDPPDVGATAGSSTEEAPSAADTGTVSEPPPEEPAMTPPVVGATGFLNVSSRPTGLEVRIDGTPAGRTPLRAEPVAVGRHLVTVHDSATGAEWSQEVTVQEGRAKVVVLGATP